jgi:type IV pilus assembly protein PilV
LVEVLVASLVLGLGLLGLAALQTVATKASDSAGMRALAVAATYDLADRLRADPNNPLIGSEPIWSIAHDGCEPAPSSTGNVKARWIKDFCALDLPAPADGDFARADCTTGAENTCGSGNCMVMVRWNDQRGDMDAARAADLGGISRVRSAADLQFRICTRLPR